MRLTVRSEVGPPAPRGRSGACFPEEGNWKPAGIWLHQTLPTLSLVPTATTTTTTMTTTTTTVLVLLRTGPRRRRNLAYPCAGRESLSMLARAASRTRGCRVSRRRRSPWSSGYRQTFQSGRAQGSTGSAGRPQPRKPSLRQNLGRSTSRRLLVQQSTENHAILSL